jgi:hypothetical protein
VRAVSPKRTIYSMLGRAVTFGIRADLTGCPVVPTGSSGSLRGVDCKIPHRRVRDVLLALLVVLVLTCCTRFGASGSEVSSRHQEQNHEGGKAHNRQYTACWAGLLQSSCSNLAILIINLCM